MSVVRAAYGARCALVVAGQGPSHGKNEQSGCKPLKTRSMVPGYGATGRSPQWLATAAGFCNWMLQRQPDAP